MNNTPSVGYKEAVRKELGRRADAVVSFCDELLGRLHREGGDTTGSASQNHLRRLVSYMVKYVLSRRLISPEFRRLVNLDTSAFRSGEAQTLCGEIQEALRGAVVYMKARIPACAADIAPEQPLTWAGLGYKMSLSQMLDSLDTRLRRGQFSDDPEIRLDQEYAGIVVHIIGARGVMRLNDDGTLAGRLAQYEGAVHKVKHLLGYGVDYAGGIAAQVLARIHFELCDGEVRGLWENDLTPLRYRFMAAYAPEVDQPSIEDVRRATTEVHSLLDAFLDELAAKSYLIDRLAAYLQLYARERIGLAVRTLLKRQRKSPRIEERVFRPFVEEFLFSQGYYPLAEPQLRPDNSRVDILNVAPEQDAWFLYELKQSGFAATAATRGDIERRLREAIHQTASYHERLVSYPAVQPDVYVVCFVRGTADFVGEDNVRLGSWHTVHQHGMRLHLRLVNLPPPGRRPSALTIRTAALIEGPDQDA